MFFCYLNFHECIEMFIAAIYMVTMGDNSPEVCSEGVCEKKEGSPKENEEKSLSGYENSMESDANGRKGDCNDTGSTEEVVKVKGKVDKVEKGKGKKINFSNAWYGLKRKVTKAFESKKDKENRHYRELMGYEALKDLCDQSYKDSCDENYDAEMQARFREDKSRIERSSLYVKVQRRIDKANKKSAKKIKVNDGCLAGETSHCEPRCSEAEKIEAEKIEAERTGDRESQDEAEDMVFSKERMAKLDSGLDNEESENCMLDCYPQTDSVHSSNSYDISGEELMEMHKENPVMMNILFGATTKQRKRCDWITYG